MRYRKLRIAFSVACGIACVLLIALWVRSYWWVDCMSAPYGFHQTLFFASYEGKTYTHKYANPDSAVWMPMGWTRQSIEIPVHLYADDPKPRFQFEAGFGHNVVVCPHGLLVGGCAVAAFVPLIRRFSLRTLLIATTLIAVVLGAIVYVTRQ
jgi:hypothetical protein